MSFDPFSLSSIPFYSSSLNLDASAPLLDMHYISRKKKKETNPTTAQCLNSQTSPTRKNVTAIARKKKKIQILSDNW